MIFKIIKKSEEYKNICIFICVNLYIYRKVLERAIVQNLPPKKMKVLFKKFISFEEKHGTSEDVERVQRVATDYIENQCGERVN